LEKIAYFVVGLLLIGGIATIGIKAVPEKTTIDVNVNMRARTTSQIDWWHAQLTS